MLPGPGGVGSGALEGGAVSFIKRAAEQAQQAADAARAMASDATRSANDPATQERLGKQAREAMGMARRGISTVVERIDPGTLAELVIKATALQEMTNNALRKKNSPYRVSEISIAASIPPGITFAITRIDDVSEAIAGEGVSSAELVEALPDDGESVIALDGTTLDAAQIDAARAALARELPDELTGD
jgi:hypothetical protein